MVLPPLGAAATPAANPAMTSSETPTRVTFIQNLIAPR
jgi:hypothetical protein